MFELVTGKIKYRVAGPKSVFGLTFSADGQYLIAASAEGRVKIFRTSDGLEIYDMAIGEEVRAVSLQASNSIMTASVIFEGGRTVIVIDNHLLRSEDLIKDTCERLTRNLSQSEWNQYVGVDTPYRKTCKNLP